MEQQYLGIIPKHRPESAPRTPPFQSIKYNRTGLSGVEDYKLVRDYWREMQEAASNPGPWFRIIDAVPNTRPDNAWATVYSHPYVDASSCTKRTRIVMSNPSSSSSGVSTDASSCWKVTTACTISHLATIRGATSVVDNVGNYTITFDQPIEVGELMERLVVEAQIPKPEVIPIFYPMIPSQTSPTKFWDLWIAPPKTAAERREINIQLERIYAAKDRHHIELHYQTMLPRLHSPFLAQHIVRFQRTFPGDEIPEKNLWSIQFATLQNVVEVYQYFSTANASVFGDAGSVWIEITNCRTIRIAHPTAQSLRQLHRLISPIACPLKIVRNSKPNRYKAITLTIDTTPVLEDQIPLILPPNNPDAWSNVTQRDNASGVDIVHFQYIEDAENFRYCCGSLGINITPNRSVVYCAAGAANVTLAQGFGPLLYAGDRTGFFVRPTDHTLPLPAGLSSELLEILIENWLMSENIHTLNTLGDVCVYFSRMITRSFDNPMFWMHKLVSKYPHLQLANLATMRNVNWAVAFAISEHHPVNRQWIYTCPNVEFNLLFRSIFSEETASVNIYRFQSFTINALSGDITDAYHAGILDEKILKLIIKECLGYRPDLLEEYRALLPSTSTVTEPTNSMILLVDHHVMHEINTGKIKMDDIISDDSIGTLTMQVIMTYPTNILRRINGHDRRLTMMDPRHQRTFDRHSRDTLPQEHQRNRLQMCDRQWTRDQEILYCDGVESLMFAPLTGEQIICEL